VALLFLTIAGVVASSQIGAEPNALLIVAAVIGGYMALTIGANDVANNVGPAVGAHQSRRPGKKERLLTPRLLRDVVAPCRRGCSQAEIIWRRRSPNRSPWRPCLR
jgi:hypothetical protein